ncbi:MAG: lipopolysaccharide biosynthesis protein [Muribaculaceae bacterium]|nr:lipopolysaccharide biosynthesis protein [Muribaculaceae bacterium]
MAENLKRKTVAGAVWTGINRFGSLMLMFVTNMILARLLTPAEFGYIAMLAVFILVADTFVDSGLGSAIIQKKDADNGDFSTVFYFNLALGVVLYLTLYFCAPLVADFYNLPLLKKLLRVEGLILIINSFAVVQTAILRKEMRFKQLTVALLTATVVGVSVAIYMAYRGFGVWALVAQMLIVAFVRAVMTWWMGHWRPGLIFSKQSFHRLFGFGSFVFMANIINTLGNNIQDLIIGKAFSAGTLGYYSQARKLETIASTSLSGIIDQVTYPALAKKQDDPVGLVSVVRKFVKMISFVSFPIIMCLAVAGRQIIPLCYGDKWMQSVPYFQILCFAGLAICMQYVNYSAVVAIGRSSAMFRWTLIKRGIGLSLVLLGLIWGIYGVLVGVAASSYVILICNAWQVQYFLRYTLWRQLLDTLPAVACTAVACVAALCLDLVLNFSLIVDLIAKIAVFGIVYLGMAYALRLEAMKDVKSIIMELKNRK